MTTPDDPSRSRGRALAPDLARGIMLLLIALANVPWFLYGAPTSAVSAHRTGAAGPDAVWQTIAIIGIDGRSYPLFAFLFGYGIWQLYTRQQLTGHDERSARRLLQRRHGWMIVFGALHAALLWYGDVLGAYGLVGLVVVRLFLHRTSRTLLRWAVALGGILALLAAAALLAGIIIRTGHAAGEAMPQLAAIAPYAASIAPRLLFWIPLTVVQGVLALVVPIVVLLAIVCARRRILESPETHRPLLVRTAVVGLAIGWAGAVPALLVQHGACDVPAWSTSPLHLLSGLFAALGYAASFALLAAGRMASGPAVRGLTAVGKRSLSCYLFQSVVFAPLLCAWGLGLGGILDQWQAALVAVVTWLASMVFAIALDRGGRRGPAEWLLRSLAYRGPVSSATPVSS